MLFSTSVYTDELKAIPAGIPMAVFGMALTMEDVLLRGTYQGIRRVGGSSEPVWWRWTGSTTPCRPSRDRSIRRWN